ncbi:uncharacterized protein [Macrobrachium rosenbergii]|uniref:uncharacterized protein n=1 Tax=Macrobrachium rosenbergii TaxID=79674 RepID=UPI0034D55B7F
MNERDSERRRAEQLSLSEKKNGESSLQRKITPPAYLSGAPPPKNGQSQKPVVCGFCKKIGHAKEQCRSKPPASLSPGQPPNKSPAPSTGAVRRDFSQTFCTACKVYGHSSSWAKCPRNNKAGTPAVALAVTNPESLGPPAEGPIYVAPPRGKYSARQVKAFDDSGAQISLIRRDKVPYGAIIDRRKLVTIEGINNFKMILPTVQLRVTRPHRARTLRLAVAKHIPGDYDVLLGQDFTSHFKPPPFRGPHSPINHPNPSPVPGTASVPVPRPQPDLPSGESRPSASLPVPLRRTEQCQSPSVQTDETTTTSPPAPVPMSVPELVTPASKSTPPPPAVPSLSPPAADSSASHDSAPPSWADELCDLRRLMSEMANKIPGSVVAAADPDGTPCRPLASGPPIPRPRTTVQGGEVRGGVTTGVGDRR